MAIVFIAAQLRDLTGGIERTEVAGTSVRQIVAELDARYPGIAGRLLIGDALAPGLAVSVDSVISNRGLITRVGPQSEVHFLPALGGG